MSVVKLYGHPSVDLLFKRAFPQMTVLDLDAGERTPNREDWRYKAIAPTFFPVRSYVEDNLLSGCALGWCLKNELGVFKPDVFIADDFFSLMVAREVRAKTVVWYCHADYMAANPHNPFQRHALSAMGDAPTIYPTRAKQESARRWRDEHPSIVVPLGVPDEAFVEAASERNGRACIVRQEIAKRIELYRPEKFKPLFAEIASRLHKQLDVYGDNNAEEWGFDLKPTLKGWVSPISVLRDYSVALEPFGNQSVSMCQLELMAAGVPVVTYPREGFEGSSGLSYLIAGTATEFEAQARAAMDLPITIGTNGQRFVRENYGQRRWTEAVSTFVGAIA